MRAITVRHETHGHGLLSASVDFSRIVYLSPDSLPAITDDLTGWQRVRVSMEHAMWLETGGIPETLTDRDGRIWKLQRLYPEPVYRNSTYGSPWPAMARLPNRVSRDDLDVWRPGHDGLMLAPLEEDDHLCFTEQTRAELEILVGPVQEV